MSEIGRNRLSVYNLLYKYPLCEHIKNNLLNILILGTGWVGNEAFKACTWASLYPGICPNITLVAENASEYERTLKTVLPGLSDFADFNNDGSSMYHYLNVSVRNVVFDNIRNNGIDSKLADDLCLKDQDYIIISLGDEEINYLVAELAGEEFIDCEKKPLIAVYGKSKPADIENVCFVNFWSDAEQDYTDLMKLGSSIHYMYEAKYDPKANRKQKNEEFISQYNKEFCEAPTDSDVMLDSVSNFTGRDYNADSSLAQAVHIPYKLAYCLPGGTDEEKLAQLVQSINKKDACFNTLIALEHRRWNVFMAIRAYRMPRKNELGYLYSEGCSHKDDNKLLHICMCECDNDGNKLDPHSKLWTTNTIPQDLSELDKMSLLCHKELVHKTQALQNQIKKELDILCRYGSSDAEKTTVIREYVNSVRKLVNDDEGANNLYKFAYERAQGINVEKSVTEAIASLNKKLKPAIIKNSRIDFLAYDAQFISMMPICLKLQGKHTTVITFSTDDNVSDVLVPWLLCADNAVFINVAKAKRQEKAEAIKKFFENHGNNTKPIFRKIDYVRSVEDVKTAISAVLEEYDDVIFNIVPNIDSKILIALGEYAGNISMVSYSAQTGLSFYNLNSILPSNVDDTVMNVNDYIELLHGEITNRFSSLVPYSKCQRIEDFFWKNNLVRYKSEQKKKIYNEWNTAIVTTFIQRKEISIQNGRELYSLPLSSDNLERKIQTSFIDLLKTEKIISDVSYDNNKAVSYFVTDKDFYWFVTEKGGNLFEALVYYKLLNTCMFGDAQTGVAFKWKSINSDYVNNEIDVVATNGVNLVLVSCKTNPVIDNGFIYEISSEAANFGAIAVLAVSQDLSSPNNPNHNAVVRANATNVALLDAHILRDEALLKKALKEILKGQYKGPEGFV